MIKQSQTKQLLEEVLEFSFIFQKAHHNIHQIYLNKFLSGWNDPPKNVGAPTGNLKINLNKRIAFPLSKASSTAPQASPLLLPPKLPAPNIVTDEEKSEIILSDDIDLHKQKVISCLEQGADELSAAVKASVLAKLKILCKDWSQTETDIKRLLVELTQCEILPRFLLIGRWQFWYF